MLSEMLVKHSDSPKMLSGTLVKPYDSSKIALRNAVEALQQQRNVYFC